MKKLILTALIASTFSLNAVVTETGAIADPAIPDNGCITDGGDGAGGLSNNAVFAQTGTITDANVEVAITHTWRGDIQMDIVNDDGATTVQVILETGQGGSADDYLAIFDDEGAAACDGSAAIACTPFNPLTAFDTRTTPSAFTLNLCDNAGGDAGTLDSWSVTLDGQPGDGLPVELLNMEID